MGSYLWLPHYEWAVIAEMEKGEILSSLREIKLAVMLTACGVILLSLLMAFGVSRRVSRPLTRVAEAAKQIAEGHLEQSIPVFGKDEIGVLAVCFNTMSQRLADLIASLRQKEESLQKAYQDLVAAQEQLVQSEKMAAIGELAASIVHEMRNPLSSIKLNLQILGRNLNKEANLAEHYQIAVDQVAQLERMFSDLLDYSKRLVIRRSSVSPEALTEKSLQQVGPELVKRSIRVERTPCAELPAILGDADKLHQALVNVLKNAIEAVGANGCITVSAEGFAAGDRPMVTIVVADSGPGIPPQHLKRIFQPFFTTKKKGTGLGLSIVKKITEAHYGDISITSENGKGTVVRLSFPSG